MPHAGHISFQRVQSHPFLFHQWRAMVLLGVLACACLFAQAKAVALPVDHSRQPCLVGASVLANQVDQKGSVFEGMASVAAVDLSNVQVQVQSQAAGNASANSNATANAKPVSTMQVVWIVVALLVAAVLFVLEIFVPSAGLIGVAACASLAVGLYLMFQISTTLGLAGLVGTLVALPILMAFGLKVLPDTPIMRAMMLHSPPAKDPAMEAAEAKKWVGQTGTAHTDLRPSGQVVVDGQKLEATAVTGSIDRGQTVVVVGQDAFGVKVKLQAVVVSEGEASA